MKIVDALKEWYYKKIYLYRSKKVVRLAVEGRYNEALEYIAEFSSHETQKELLTNGLFGIAMKIVKEKNPEIEFQLTTDKEEYERFKYIVGSSSSVKRLLYQNPGSTIADFTDIIEEVVPLDNPIRKYCETRFKSDDKS